MKEAVRDKRFKSWGSQFESPVVEPYSKKRQGQSSLSKSKLLIFRLYFKIKEFLLNFLK